ncbi:MAG: NADP oxidoreductase [Desulforhopalus sp.]|nr:NADP oxidoreductase [Desulforhopalus sp.]
MAKITLATTWLDGCSGCHMSLLDIDELLLDLADKIDLLYGPLVDGKIFPDHVDVTLVEGAVSSEADRKNIENIRDKTGLLVSFGDCAITANVPGMRNRHPVEAVLNRVYVENAETTLLDKGGESSGMEKMTFHTVPRLCRMARPVHEFVKVDVFLPGCPPPPAAIAFVITELLAGKIPEIGQLSRFGA